MKKNCRNKIFYIGLLSIFTIVFNFGCSEKEFNPDDPAGSFVIAREPYDDGNYEYALTKLGEFKSRFPYSKFTSLAELYIADSQYKLGRYEEAAASYSQFVKLHPKHEKAPYAMYRIGESYWVDAPEEINRDQELTQKALEEWDKLVVKFPESEYTKQAKEKIEQGNRRIAESQEFIVKFYCKMDVYHACAFRALDLADKYPRYRDIYKNAIRAAISSFRKLAKEKEKDPESDKNIYFKQLTAAQMIEKANELEKLLAKLPENG